MELKFNFIVADKEIIDNWITIKVTIEMSEP